MTVLLIEDEVSLSTALCQSLKNEHYCVTPMYDGEAGLLEALTGIYDVIILDIMLPKKDGFEVLHELRRANLSTPVLILTAKSSVENKITGLDLGANYYLTKPFDTNELLACLRAITRETGHTAETELSYGDLILKTKQGGIYCTTTNKFIKMSAKELHLLEIFIKNKEQILEKEFLIERIWGLNGNSEYNNIEVYVSFLRKKISFVGSNVKLKSTRGLGYSLERD